jgi:hypothetical protein
LLKREPALSLLVTSLSEGHRVRDVVASVGGEIPTAVEWKHSEFLVELFAKGEANRSEGLEKLLRNLTLGNLASSKTSWFSDNWAKPFLKRAIGILGLKQRKKNPASAKTFNLQAFLRIIPTVDVVREMSRVGNRGLIFVPGSEAEKPNPFKVDELRYYQDYLGAELVPPSILWIAKATSEWQTAERIAAQIPALSPYALQTRRSIISAGLSFIECLANSPLYSPNSARPETIVRKSRRQEVRALTSLIARTIQEHWSSRRAAS